MQEPCLAFGPGRCWGPEDRTYCGLQHAWSSYPADLLLCRSLRCAGPQLAMHLHDQKIRQQNGLAEFKRTRSSTAVCRAMQLGGCVALLASCRIRADHPTVL